MNKEKLVLKLRNMEYFVMKMTDLTTEEKIDLLGKIGEIKTSVEPIIEGKEVKNVNENIESSDKSDNNTTNGIRRVEEHTEKGELKKK